MIMSQLVDARTAYPAKSVHARDSEENPKVPLHTGLCLGLSSGQGQALSVQRTQSVFLRILKI